MWTSAGVATLYQMPQVMHLYLREGMIFIVCVYLQKWTRRTSANLFIYFCSWLKYLFPSLPDEIILKA